MKATKMRNKQFYRASFTTLSNQVAAHLSKELQKKYSKRSVRLTEGDNVKIVRGEYKGVDGKVTKVSTIKNSVAIEGIKKEKSKGEKIDVYIRASNVIVTDLNSDDKWRIHKLEGKKPKSIPKEPKIKSEKTKDLDVKQKVEIKPISKTTTPKKEKSNNVNNEIVKKNIERKSEK